MAESELADKHLSELHAEAARLGVPGYRMLRREALIEAIAEEVEDGPEVQPTDEAEGAEEESEPAEPEERERREPETEQVSGVLDRTYRGYGFLRLRGLEPAPGDVYISASQIRRCELRLGDLVSGPARPPARGERYPALVHVDLVNGVEPVDEE
jgi:transcription termination factor Rho